MQIPMAAAHDFSSKPQVPDSPHARLKTGDAGPLLSTFAGPQVFDAPWGFQWQWHNGKPPEISSQDRATGQISVHTSTNADTKMSDAHGGFGVVMTSDKVRSVTGRSLRRTTHAGGAIAGLLGGSATAEGGMEMTALDGAALLGSAQDRLFRVRSTSGEAHFEDPGAGGVTGSPIEVDWVMLPRRVYTFNVGAWVFARRTAA